MVIVEWAVAISLYWLVSALFLGGAPIRMENTGGVREVGGLLVGFVAYLAAWRVLVTALGGALSPFVAFVVGSLLSAALIPIVNVLSLRLFGTRVRRGEAHGH